MDRATREKNPSSLGEVEGLQNWHFSRHGSGWFAGVRPFLPQEDLDILAHHGGWYGPVKLADEGGKIEQRAEFFLGNVDSSRDDPALDEEAGLQQEELLQNLRQLECLKEPAGSDAAWEPPAAKQLAGWLAESGIETAIDQEQNLRLTLKRRGCDGAVRLTRAPGHLRVQLLLGRWENLEPEALAAMKVLTREANARYRLVRIAWREEEKAWRCEAQVDLSGLPSADAQVPCRQQLWRDMLRLSMAGLELALRQLGLELPLLGETQNRGLVERLLSGQVSAR